MGGPKEEVACRRHTSIANGGGWSSFFCLSTWSKVQPSSSIILPIVVGLAVELRVSGVAGVIEAGIADAALETMFVVTRIRHSHQVPITYLLATSFADLKRPFALDGHIYCRD